MMEIKSFNLDELYQEAEKELESLKENSTLSTLSKKRLLNFLESYTEMGENNHCGCHQNTFSIVLDDLPVDLINDMNLISHKSNLSKGKIIEILMRNVIQHPENLNEKNITATILKPYIKPAGKFHIVHYDNLDVSAVDLQEIKEQISFIHINSLKFEDSIEEEEFLAKIDKIIHCKYVYIPSNFAKLSVLSKIHHSTNIIFS